MWPAHYWRRRKQTLRTPLLNVSNIRYYGQAPDYAPASAPHPTDSGSGSSADSAPPPVPGKPVQSPLHSCAGCRSKAPSNSSGSIASVQHAENNPQITGFQNSAPVLYFSHSPRSAPC